MNGIALIQSRTFWLAAIQAVLGGVVIFIAAYPAVGWLLIAKSALDIILRIYTNEPVTGTLSTK